MPRTKISHQQAVEEIKRTLGRSPEAESLDQEFLDTGSTLLNLALSDRVDGGWLLGTMANLIGDSSSGKTFLCLNSFPEAVSHLDKSYRLIYDDAENASEFDLPRLFGKEAAIRVEPPRMDDDGEPCYSRTVEEFSGHVLSALDDGRPFIYILDSFDAISSKAEQEKTREVAEEALGGKQARGSYGMDKAKIASVVLRQLTNRLKKSKSLLIIISQTRDNIDPLSFQKKTRSGGRALKFYATHEIWLAVKQRLREGPYKLAVGIESLAKVSKNKVTGKERTAPIFIFNSYGIDDVTGCVRWLVAEGRWPKKNGGKIQFREDEDSLTESKLIRKIESDPETRAHMMTEVGELWKEREESVDLIKQGRKPRYQ